MKVYLTIDVESDYARSDRYEMLDRARPFLDWLRAGNVPMTAFVIGRLFVEGHRIIDDLLSAGVSVAVHGFRHTTETFGTMDSSHAAEIHGGVDAFLKRTGRLPAGYRAPLGIVSGKDILLLDKMGLRYDASVFPVRRPGRYDFSTLPRTPFRWERTSLLEVPFGTLFRGLPAGMTFINLMGPALAEWLVRRQAAVLPAAAGPVIYLHFHNLFHSAPAMRDLPAGLKLIYTAGRLQGGLACLISLVDRLRAAGITLADLEKDALELKADALPAVSLDCFRRESD